MNAMKKIEKNQAKAPDSEIRHLKKFIKKKEQQNAVLREILDDMQQAQKKRLLVNKIEINNLKKRT
jgi:hypothetical protein